MGYSVGIGLTNDCNLTCDHCYRDTGRIDNIGLRQVQQICEAIPVDAVGMGTGENALNPEFESIVRFLHRRGTKLSVASNGYTLTTIPDDVLQAFHDVEVSIDFATAADQDAFRGPGNWRLVHQAVERCQKLGIEVTGYADAHQL
jgi:MoaA/NifB/PqqE/SkfB family radical SAM enzyme